jgi:gamma-glutamyltranspeptidase/glutathione hydrolase
MILTIAFITAIACCVPIALGSDRPTGASWATRSEVIARNGMAATSHPLATQIAIDVLRQGGTAVDAAIAANAALGLMEPTSCGIGGDLFAIVWDAKSRTLYGLNASGRSPSDLTIDYFTDRKMTEIPLFGPLPVSVPGCVDGWFELHRRFGALPMDDILAPAIQYAKEGFPLSEVTAYYWDSGLRRLKEYPNFAKTYGTKGRAPAKGELFRNPDLARTYQTLARVGRDVFYKGEIARTIDAFCQKHDCFLRLKDLAAHQSEWVTPLSTDYRGYEVWELPPNGQGIAVLQMLNILEDLKLDRMGHNSATYLHHLIEAKKIVYEDRARFYADPEFHALPIDALISKAYASQRRALLHPQKAGATFDAGNPRLDQGDTIYLTVADKNRNMVSLIQSNYAGFGSGLVPDGLGFCLQNRGALFTLDPDHVNVYEPNKRPFHTIIPAFVTKKGKPWVSFGVMGGSMQPQGHVQVLCNLIDFGMNLQEAGDAARFRHLGSSQPTGTRMTDGGEVRLESGIPQTVREELAKRGHKIVNVPTSFGGYQAILYDAEHDVYIGASESRKDGQAAGY